MRAGRSSSPASDGLRKSQTTGPGEEARLHYIALLYRSEGSIADAESLFRSAFEIREAALGPDDPDTVLSLSRLAEAVIELGRYDKAEALYKRLLSIKADLGPMIPIRNRY